MPLQLELGGVVPAVHPQTRAYGLSGTLESSWIAGAGSFCLVAAHPWWSVPYTRRRNFLGASLSACAVWEAGTFAFSSCATTR